MFGKVVDYIRSEIRTPYSTLSNLTYLILGILSWNINVYIALLMIGIFVGSTGYHWAHEGHESWHRADIVAIYYTFAVIAGWLLMGGEGLVIGTIFGLGAHWSHYYGYSKYSQQIIGIFGMFCLMGFIMQPENGWLEFASVMCWFGLAFATSYIADHVEKVRGKVYDGFHAIWHILSGIGIYDLITTGTPLFFT